LLKRFFCPAPAIGIAEPTITPRYISMIADESRSIKEHHFV